MITTRPQTRYRAAGLGGALVGIALALGGCQHDEVATATIPDDYKQRHPIAIEEQNRSIVVFVGHARGGLTAAQRADVMGLASTWLHEGTGAIHIDVPSGTPNARPVAESMREIQAMLAAAGVPPRGIVARPYQPEDKRFLPPIRLTYSRIAAVAGPCGLWPEDLGPSIKNKSWFENKEYYNFGCSYQRNMAAMVDNPSDLEQPRSETPSYTPRRMTAFEKYRKGMTTTTTYPEADKAKLSDTGK
ncbi:CpaD family pilus assembly protein [Bradyrhizobium sp. GCM10027634]|uniref:CpaD family pilus assembly protein n=1 Tax=unclassified Bradyrhizobium TaxID=2631580 RepID=UPI00188A24EF|nr:MULTISPECIES: CpaD family pilus assembly protein [unclassified Bradyrhizobium]MDN5000256.1 CpaD family pilus assembly protein [Bradyrhizobium sp. WYCCWR 12677]QOZ42972.1 pilus assembly protein CpaD [Bradyrhizobium sp. CCBAU 53340]